MPNRILKESICYSEEIEKLSNFQENFFYRLIVNCDDFGRMDARPKVLAAKLFPLRDMRTAQITDALRALTSAELVVLYEKDGHPFLQMKTWDRHQSIRAKKSKYPGLESDCKQLNADDFICMQMKSNESKCPRNPIQSESESESYSGTPVRKRTRSAPDYSPLFSSFWSAYPRKESKPDAWKAFEKLNPDEALLQTMLSAIEKQKATAQWQDDGGRYIPHPATWLNNRRWEDEVKPAAQSKPQEKTVIAQGYEQRDYSEEREETPVEQMARLKREMEEGL